MTESTLICKQPARRAQVRRAGLNGLDYVEVCDDLRSLTVYFLDKAPQDLTADHFRIEGGSRVADVRVTGLRMCYEDDPELDDCVTLTIDKPGDASTYTLLIGEPDRRGGLRPMDGIDPRFARVSFSFADGCAADLDCKARRTCPVPPRQEPDIDVLAKDYASFRQLILDRLSLVMPDWQERHVPDVGIALVELLAYEGDALSYYQDAVATEAYLDTARLRTSVRRHVRLVDYAMHEGTNARAWVHIDTDTDLQLDPEDVYFVAGDARRIAAGAALQPGAGYEVFEPVPETLRGGKIRVFQAHNTIQLYTWGDRQCCLPRGATKATLRDEWLPAPEPEKPYDEPYPPVDQKQEPYLPEPEKPGAAADVPGQADYPPGPVPAGAAVYDVHAEAAMAEQAPVDEDEGGGTGPVEPCLEPIACDAEAGRRLCLEPGDLLLFEEIVGPETGVPGDANPLHRHVVRLTRVERGEDRTYDPPIPVLEVEWAPQDALPFPLCLSAIGPAPECALNSDISVARGNIVLADSGVTVTETVGPVPAGETDSRCEAEGRPSEVEIRPRRFRPHLSWGPLVFRHPPRPGEPAAGLLAQDPRQAVPALWVSGTWPTAGGDVVTEWAVRRDLMASYGDDAHVMAEVDNDGRAVLRFGDNELGRAPDGGTLFDVRYRVGRAGDANVGAGAISRIGLRCGQVSGVNLRARNPLPTTGGTPPEPLAEVKLLAPYAFRHELRRAVTAEDYAALAQRHPQVQRAAATLRWTGSRTEVLVAVDPKGMVEAGDDLLREIEASLWPYRRIGHSLAIRQARYVPLDVELEVCVKPGFIRGHVKAALLDALGSHRLPGGELGFFHPDRLSFGQGVSVSALVAAARSVQGVESVVVKRLQRYGEPEAGEIEDGILPLGPLEVARLDDDPNFPENGRLSLAMAGGQ